MVAIVVLLWLLVWFTYNLAERGGFFYPAGSVTQLSGHNPTTRQAEKKSTARGAPEKLDWWVD
jgi:hypothetical protein